MKTDILLSDYELIVFDINGTLAGSSNTIHPLVIETLQRLEETGVRLTLATGLNLISAKPFADVLAVELPLILSNGSIIETRHGEISFRAVIKRDISREIIQICETENQDLVIYIDNEIFIREMTDNIYPIYDYIADKLIELGEWYLIDDQLRGANKMLVADVNSEENLDHLGAIFRERFGEHIDVVRSSSKLVEVMPKGINKAEGLRQLGNVLGIPIEKIMAFGDYDNDAEMLAAAGLGIAVGNASNKAKAAADIVVGSVDENGPAVFLNKLMKQE
jgi:Cof subfamily protein (haloacid dehalogenase superfamily)